jgi:single-stranded DNA-binding protein
MFQLTATGFITGEVKVEDGQYGKRGMFTLRARSGNGKDTHYVNVNVYGKKIDVAQKYMLDGRQVTVSGSVKSVLGKKRKDGTDYCAFYLDCNEFSLPERMNSEERPAPNRAAAEEEIPF